MGQEILFVKQVSRPKGSLAQISLSHAGAGLAAQGAKGIITIAEIAGKKLIRALTGQHNWYARITGDG